MHFLKKEVYISFVQHSSLPKKFELKAFQKVEIEGPYERESVVLYDAASGP